MDDLTKTETAHVDATGADLPYADLHAHIAALERDGHLVRVQRPINKDTKMHALVRWQFRGGIPEAQRKGFLFENVTNSKGKRYDIPVAVGILAFNRDIYSLGIAARSRTSRSNGISPSSTSSSRSLSTAPRARRS